MLSARSLLLGFIVVLVAACGDGRRNGGTTILLRDGGGGFLDAGNNGPPRDGGVDMVRDGGPFVPGRDGGVRPGRDGGSVPPRDGGVNTVRDAGPAQALTIYDIQDVSSPLYPGENAAVELRNVVVTAVVTEGGQAGSFYVQESAGGQYSGVFVFLPMNAPVPSVQVGDRVTLTGTLEEYFGLTEVRFGSLIARTAGTPLTPEVVSAASIATGGIFAEGYECVLVEVQNVSVTDPNPDAPMDFGEFAVTGGLRVDNALWPPLPRPPLGTQIDFVAGVLHYAFENFKLLPRGGADIQIPN
ncbi:MAG: hypothetical protein RMA76_03895 [Deltaproteobacteria bacterium]